ncbi:MAG TPA: hypothetical protein VFJ97_14590 [Dermatophilaceae bacterium]|nr:hypothetical protein [Dermatophilaceae bacterium]
MSTALAMRGLRALSAPPPRLRRCLFTTVSVVGVNRGLRHLLGEFLTPTGPIRDGGLPMTCGVCGTPWLYERDSLTPHARRAWPQA